MNKKIKAVLCILISLLWFVFDSDTAYSQNEATVWDEMKTITADDYELSVPSDWRDFSSEMTHVENYFEEDVCVLMIL